jgi:formamidopyrimidine-DNA glycosylase
MPELPEVETIKRGLQKYIIGRTIDTIVLYLPKLFSGEPQFLSGAKVTDVRRFGKGLVIDFSNDYSLAIHIKMTGQLIFRGEEIDERYDSQKIGCLPGPFTHIIIRFRDGSSLYYNDIRQFGWMKLVKTKEIANMQFFRDLGLEPPLLTRSTQQGKKYLTYKIFSQILNTTKKPIKVLLMDQKKIAGIGNIYANDALFVAQIDPRRSACSLSKKEKDRLFEAIKKVLNEGIRLGGASDRQYVNILGQTGKYQHVFKVYGKEGKPCSRCGNLIKRIKQGGRSTFFCYFCQK